MRRDGREVVLEPGGSSTTADDQTAKPTKKASKNPPSATNPSSKMGSPHSTPSVVVASVIPGANSTDLKQSSELTISKISSTAGQEGEWLCTFCVCVGVFEMNSYRGEIKVISVKYDAFIFIY